MPHTEDNQGIIKKPSLGRYAEGLTQKDIKKLVEAEVGTQIERLKDYYRRGYPTFEITGGNDLKKHDLAEFELDTKSGQGILFTNTGNAKVLGNASLELISNGKKSGGGGFDKDGEAGVVIYAKDGVIHIESVRGTVNIKARKNIQLEAMEDINLIAHENITFEAGNCPNGYSSLGTCGNFNQNQSDCLGSLTQTYFSDNLSAIGDCAEVRLIVGTLSTRACGRTC